MSLRTENVSLSYGDGDKITYAVRDISVSFPERGFYGIMGPSGSGKSSLLYLLSGLKLPTSGDVFYEEKSLPQMGEKERGLNSARTLRLRVSAAVFAELPDRPRKRPCRRARQ